MELYKIINAVGLVVNLIGAFLMFYHTPKISGIVMTGDAGLPDDLAYKNKWIRLGMIILAIGFLIQLISTFLN